MRPYYKFAAPLVGPSPAEAQSWADYREDQIDASELKQRLAKVHRVQYGEGEVLPGCGFSPARVFSRDAYWTGRVKCFQVAALALHEY